MRPDEMHTGRHVSLRPFHQFTLDAPDVRDDRTRLQTGSPLKQMPLVGIDRRREDDKVRILYRLLRVHNVPVNSAHRHRRLEVLDAPAYADDVGRKPFAAENHAERTADEAHPDDDRSTERRLHYRSLPTA